jgi:peptide/nickel transport system permease protein
LRRLIIAIPTLLAITFVVFAILALAPTDPISQFGADPRVPPAARANIRSALGLDDPCSVSDLILQRLPNTLAVVGVAYFLLSERTAERLSSCSPVWS